MTTDQALQELKEDLGRAMTALANLKDRARIMRRDADNLTRQAAEAERRASNALVKLKEGQISQAEADEAALTGLKQKEELAGQGRLAAGEAERLEKAVDELSGQVNEIKATISRFEGELLSLKARGRAASAALRVNEAMATFDPSAATALMDSFKAKVEEEEALAEAYGRLADQPRSLDAAIDRALAGDPEEKAEKELKKMKKELGI